MEKVFDIGVDIGSTTIKVIILKKSEIIYKTYKRHNADIKKSFVEVFNEVKEIIFNKKIRIKISGSSGMLISDFFDLEFIQEVVSSTKAIKKYIPSTDVAIELGGEDAKITYFGNAIDQRMNGACAGGTGAFIDQMAILLNTNAKGVNDLAKDYETIYPIASRCGVFAKTDVQPLINEGVARQDISASILQAVVNQTIGGLSAGKKIKGKVAFLGGPLTYLSELRNLFIDTLDLKKEEVIFPNNSLYFVALGAALSAKETNIINSKKIYDKFNEFLNFGMSFENRLDPLFESQNDYKKFKNRHDKNVLKEKQLSKQKGSLFIGIDAGSTTSKIAITNSNKELVYSFYANNNGDPLETIRKELIRIYNKIPKEAYIANSCVTGYGEKLIKESLLIDHGEIETISHYKAASLFNPEVDFVLDIGGQDMKSLKINKGVIESIMLNEACSSGCGSFIETFAKSLSIDLKTFINKALFAKKPVDLGTRCTVFMNSKVKQSQKEGASLADIAAGISYSIIKNALYKVIRLKKVSDLGENIVVQGGTFLNDAVLRALEKIIDKKVTRPNVAGLMGALGASIIANERYIFESESNILSKKQLIDFTINQQKTRCNLCGNQCLLTVHKFNDGRQFISGNRCERGSGKGKKYSDVPNLYDYKYQRLFKYKSLDEKKAVNGTLGIPRVLNMYENFPFWFTFFTNLNYKVVLSSRSNQDIFEKGMDSIPSESVCYPAKLVHGHIEDLVQKNVDNIFYPSIPYEIKEDKNANNNYNCPVVTSYPETIKANMDSIKDINYVTGFFPLHDKSQMLKKVIEFFNHSKKDLKSALNKAYKELEEYKKDIRKKGEKILKKVKKEDEKAIVLAGRPYHIDPEINHGIADVIKNYGIPVLTEDSIAHLAKVDRPIRAIDQWTYHTRLYNAAKLVSESENLEIIQLNSFGCGLDAVTIDQVKEIIERNNKIYTTIKIDEINNLGAARIRIRSLLAVMYKRKIKKTNKKLLKRTIFTKKMKDKYTILAPQMSPIHFQFLQAAFQSENYDLKVLENVDEDTVNQGLKYVNNDACYPSLLVVGQIMQAINSGNYNLDRLAILISQTGGGCRATNYIAFIRKALKDRGLNQIPVISLNANGMEKNPGFKIYPKLLKKAMIGLVYGDLLSKVILKTRPYEKKEGQINKLSKKWEEKAIKNVKKGSLRKLKKDIYRIVEEFDNVKLKNVDKPKVGIVGEILVKFHPGANNHLINFLEQEGAEVIVPDLIDFLLYSSYNSVIKRKLLKDSFLKSVLGKIAIKYIEYFRKDLKNALKKSKRFNPPMAIDKLANKASDILSLGHQTGEGWFLTSEMLELLESNVNSIACIQPFACLPNHITGKAMIKKIKSKFPDANITAIDYDPGSSKVNQINRLKLMLSTAKDQLTNNINKK
ncbi:MAG: acyl-CoA dehydratase activase-related protein [Bacillota bacterium]